MQTPRMARRVAPRRGPGGACQRSRSFRALCSILPHRAIISSGSTGTMLGVHVLSCDDFVDDFVGAIDVHCLDGLLELAAPRDTPQKDQRCGFIIHPERELVWTMRSHRT